MPPDHCMYSNNAQPPPEKWPQNAPLCRSATVFLLNVLWEFSSPGPGCSSLTGAWHRVLGWLRDGRRPQHPSPCSPSVPQPCGRANSPGGTGGCRGVSQCLGVGWGCAIRGILAVQERDLQFKLVLCRARGGLVMGRVLQCSGGFAMCRTLQSKEGLVLQWGSCYVCLGVPQFEGPLPGGVFPC